MRRTLLGLLCVTILGVGVFIGAQPRGDRIKIRLNLVDTATGKSVTGIVRVTDADRKTVELPGLFDRMTSLTKDLPGIHWYVVPVGGAETTLPRGKLRIEAVSGLETRARRARVRPHAAKRPWN